MNKTVYITRGVSGSGKSTFADSIKALNPETIICCADDYFTDEDGNYNFNPSKIKDAHAECKKTFTDAVIGQVNTIVVSNTNTQEWEFEAYKILAEEAGYNVIVMVLENRHGGTNTHGVPENIIERQESNVRKSLKLI